MATYADCRFEARISADTRALLKRAAELQGRSMSEFVISTAREAAQRAVAEAEILMFSERDQLLFAEALLDPPKPNEALSRALAKHDEMFGG
ncbi:type II toxin-antitoxin system TacA family antitoxin [Neisseria yangbaofengii]|uniref:type II toxin-antitoxin system TacA family antitoxin n=1 Tax=Neisseria yangbaofengii TaxID=2709396 RepID=UPI0013E9B2F2|nr:DUF1778 domain-containing protein [Neisseria yangbaofengii]